MTTSPKALRAKAGIASLFVSLAALVLAVSVAACSSSKGSATCADGHEGCRCFPNNSCFAGLTCASSLCVSLGAGGATGGANSSGGVIGSGGSLGTAGSVATSGGSSGAPADASAAGGTTDGAASGGVIGSGGSLGTAGSVTTGGSSDVPADAGGGGGAADGGGSGGMIDSGAGSGGAGQAGAGGAAGSTSTGGASGLAGSSASSGPAGGAIGSGGATGTGGRATGGSSGGATGGAVSTGGVSGCGTLIDDFEANTGYICRDNGRVGSWFSYKDAASTFWPVGAPSLPSPLNLPRGTSQRALHAYGTVVQYAGIGCFINNVPTLTYNASAYTGVQFYMMGTASAPKLYVQTRATEAVLYGGTCPLATLTCSGNGAPIPGILPSDWTLVSIPFSSLAGGYVTFSSSDVWSIEFQPGPGAFDFWIDDLSFY